jgi:hypothetical protein
MNNKAGGTVLRLPPLIIINGSKKCHHTYGGVTHMQLFFTLNGLQGHLLPDRLERFELERVVVLPKTGFTHPAVDDSE